MPNDDWTIFKRYMASIDKMKTDGDALSRWMRRERGLYLRAPALGLQRSAAVVAQGSLGDAAPARHKRNVQSARCGNVLDSEILNGLMAAVALDVGERCCS